MIIYRRFIHFSSRNLENTKCSFQLLDRLAKSAHSHDNDNSSNYLEKSSQDASLEPINSVLARWKKEYIRSPERALHPKKVLEKVDEWKRLVDGIGETNSLHRHLQQRLEELLRPNVTSYVHIIQAVGMSINERSQQQKEEQNQNKAYFIDDLLKRLIEESKTDFSIQPNISAFSAVMDAWAKSNRHRNFVSKLQNEGKEIFSSSEKVEELLRCMERLDEGGWPNLQPNVVVYNILLNAWAKEGQVKRIEDTLQRMIRLEIPGVSPDPISYSTLLNAYAKLGTSEAANKADSLLSQMIELHSHGMESSKPNIVSFGTVMQCHAKLGNGKMAEKWLQRLQDLFQRQRDPDWKPDLPLYNTVIQAWAKSGQPEKAEGFFRYMMAMNYGVDNADKESDNNQDLSVQPNYRTFNLVLSAWAKVGEAERAEEILMEMHKLYVEDDFDSRPTVVSYNTVLDSYAQKASKMMKAKKNTGNNRRNKKKKEHGGHSNQRDDMPWIRAEAILNHMIELYQGGDLSVKPTARTWNTVINVCAKAGRIDQAEKILRRFTSFSKNLETGSTEKRENMTPCVRTWNTLLSSCATEGDTRRAKRFWLQMKENGIEPDIVSYNTFLNCYVHSSRGRKRVNKNGVQEVESIFNTLLHDANVNPNHITYLAIVNFWINQGSPKRAELFLLDMCNASQESNRNEDTAAHQNYPPAPNRTLFHYLLTSWGELREPKKAEALLLKMAELSDDQGFDVRPTTETYNRLLNCWAKSTRVESGERAEVILREMEGLDSLGDHEATPDIYSYNSVLNAWANSGDAAALTRIDNLFLEMLLKGNPSLLPDSASYGTWLKAIVSYDETNKKKRVEEVVKTMKIHNFQPNDYMRRRIQSLTTAEKDFDGSRGSPK